MSVSVPSPTSRTNVTDACNVIGLLAIALKTFGTLPMLDWNDSRIFFGLSGGFLNLN
jgi:hypothetical protein